MPVVIALMVSFLIGLFLTLRFGIENGRNIFLAWIISCVIMPAFILLVEFVLPYMGGGSMWPIALVVGSILGAMAGGLGVVVAVYYLDWRSKKEKN